MVNDIGKYKRALVLTKELKEILPILDEFEKKLSRYHRYIPILACLETIGDAKIVLKTHYEAQKKIVNSKGERE